jgi:hypothetical protein
MITYETKQDGDVTMAVFKANDMNLEVPLTSIPDDGIQSHLQKQVDICDQYAMADGD